MLFHNASANKLGSVVWIQRELHPNPHDTRKLFMSKPQTKMQGMSK